MTSTKTILTALTLALAVAAPTAAQAQTTPQLVKDPVLFVDPSLGQDTVAIAFRTSAPLQRKANGKSLDGGAGLRGAASIMTFSKQPPMYLAFLGPHVTNMTVGHRYTVTVQIGDQKISRKVVLQKRTTERVIRMRLAR